MAGRARDALRPPPRLVSALHPADRRAGPGERHAPLDHLRRGAGRAGHAGQRDAGPAQPPGHRARRRCAARRDGPGRYGALPREPAVLGRRRHARGAGACACLRAQARRREPAHRRPEPHAHPLRGHARGAAAPLDPWLQAGGLFLTVLIGFVVVRYQRRAEGEKAWTAMARELAHQLGTPLIVASGMAGGAPTGAG
jgi:hypothetical protein